MTVSVAAILLSLAAPGFQNFINSTRIAGATNELVAALNLARSEAVKRGVIVTVCKSANPNDASPTCTTSGGWQAGWLTFTDSGTRGTVDGSDARLRVKQPSNSAATITGDSNFSNFVSYLPGGESLGESGSSSGMLTVCVGGIKSDITVNSTGHIHIDKGTC
ncbi:MAG TPA: GspH/FimT family pseudopilin [Methylocaldum sp.]|nr:GspH/FimT family pseudopilin [Methylocaldum sp.]HYE34441.1 GspH/FimT family pseudopilin [Methylocaldum sp.]